MPWQVLGNAELTQSHFAQIYPLGGQGQHEKTGRLEMIPSCLSSLTETTVRQQHCQKNFHSVLTNRGVCSAFNTVQISSYFAGEHDECTEHK